MIKDLSERKQAILNWVFSFLLASNLAAQDLNKWDSYTVNSGLSDNYVEGEEVGVRKKIANFLIGYKH